jgi:hypothetical protein
MTGRTRRVRSGALRASVLKAVWDLDPASIVEERETVPDEYDSLVDGIVFRIESGHGADEIERWLSNELETVRRLPFEPAMLSRVVRPFL